MKKIFFLFYFFSSFVLSTAQNKNTFIISNIANSSKIIDIDKYWKFHDGDNSTWALPDIDDNNWDTIVSDLRFNKDGSNKFKGICWLRVHLYIDSTDIQTPLCFMISQNGASELYLDGKLIHKLGVVSETHTKEIKYDPNNTPLSLQFNKPGYHVLSIRYSNTNFRELYKSYSAAAPGINVSITKLDRIITEQFSRKIVSSCILVAISIFFFTLGFVHLLLFLFYRKQKTNYYYTIFVVLLGTVFIFPLITGNSSDPELSIKISNYFPILLLAFFYSMLTMEYYLLEKSIKKSFWVTTAIILLISFAINWAAGINDTRFFTVSFVIGTIFASFSIVIKAIRRKIDGAWIIGTGSIFFLIFLSINVIFIVFKNGVTYSVEVNGIIGYVFLVTILLAIMSIPISMSIYLAREFAQTNKRLEKKLIEVEDLSEKSIEQEKEKQKILETQKDILEIQVEERTHEIVEQKKLIEEKNKDITDSINYAKRIQEAILPETNSLINLFPDSFILFKPKDIVSGDFYWFAEHQGKKIIAVADCTGHGVPGALMSMIGSNILNKLVIENGITQPDQILNMLNEEIRTALKQKENGSETRDGMDISLISINGNTLEYAGAHRPVWLIRNNELEETKADKFAIGGIQQEQKRVFSKHILNLQKNDALYLSSDGFADQFGGENGKKLMTKNFKELLLKIQNKSMMEQKDFLKTTIEKWKGSREQIDDILVIGIKI